MDSGPRAFCGEGGPPEDPHYHLARCPCSCGTKLARSCRVRACVCSAHSPPQQLLLTVVADEGTVCPQTGPRAAPPLLPECPLPRASDPHPPPHPDPTGRISYSPTACLTPHPVQPCPALCWCPSLKGSCAEAGPAVAGCSAPTLPTDLCSPFLQRGGTDAVPGAAGPSGL